MELVKSQKLYEIRHLLNDIPDVTIAWQFHQFVEHRLIVNERVQIFSKERIWNPDSVPRINADRWVEVIKGEAGIAPWLSQVHRDRGFLCSHAQHRQLCIMSQNESVSIVRFWYFMWNIIINLVIISHAYTNRRWRNPARTQHNHVLRRRVCVHDDLRADKLRKGWGFQVGTWNVDSLTGRAGELVQALADREVDVGCIQETRWRGSCCKFFGAQGKRYKLYLLPWAPKNLQQL